MTPNQKTRQEVPPQYKWHLHNICPNPETWHNRIASIKQETTNLKTYQNQLTNPTTLKSCLENLQETKSELHRLYVYAHMKHHEDTTVTENKALADIADSAITHFTSTTSFINPEILTLSKEIISNFISTNPQYSHYLQDLLRQKPHILTPETEAVLAEAYEIGNAPQNIFSMINNADIKFETITNEHGIQVEVTQNRYLSLLQSPNRQVRQDAFNAHYDSWWKQKHTLAATYNASVKKDIFFARTRKHPSALDAALFDYNIPREVYENLISTTHSFLPALHRYMALRKKALGLTNLHIYDIHAPIIEELDITVPYEEAKTELLEGLTPLGQDYLNTMQKGMNSGWIDVYENTGKQKGAYSWGSYGTHPYVLMNYEDKGLKSMFTLAHEMGHAMHSYLTWANQPNIYASYSMFLAEVASTVNETLLIEHMLNTAADPKMKAYLLNEYIKQFVGTVFSQVMNAEFEAETHAMAECGKPLTLEYLNNLYRNLNAKYYGPELILDDKLDIGWARIPHFYRAFYVYQYATGYSAAVAITKGILGGGIAREEARDAYLNFLKSGCSNYPINILKRAGVDMSTSAPIQEALLVFENLVAELEATTSQIG